MFNSFLLKCLNLLYYNVSILIDYEDKILWLKNNTEPIQTLQTYWLETIEYRLKKKENVMELYPGIQRPTGYILVIFLY